MPAKEPVIVFLHIPRTGGGTLRSILAEQYAQHLTVRNPIRQRDVERANQDDIQLIQGHVDFGFHKRLRRPCRYLTMLRDPVERIISVYQYFLENPASAYAHYATSARDLREFVQCAPSSEVENTQTRRLAGAEPSLEDHPARMLEAALEHMRHRIEVVSLTERFAESVLLMQRSFGWNRVKPYRRQNVSSGRPSRDALSRETVRTIEQRNELDVVLYGEAMRSFDEQMSVLRALEENS